MATGGTFGTGLGLGDSRYLPAGHTDLVLAANLAEIVGSEDLYVAWSHETGPGAIPEIEAVLVEARPISALSESIGRAVGLGWSIEVTSPTWQQGVKNRLGDAGCAG